MNKYFKNMLMILNCLIMLMLTLSACSSSISNDLKSSKILTNDYITGFIDNNNNLKFWEASGNVINVPDTMDFCIVPSGLLAVKNDGTLWLLKGNKANQIVGVNNVKSITGFTNDGISVLLRSGEVHDLKYTYKDKFTLNDKTIISNITKVIANNSFVNVKVALKSDGTVWTWGKGKLGGVGNGSFNDSQTPVEVLGLTNVKDISAGCTTDFAIKDDGTVWGWGDNEQHQLGEINDKYVNKPVQILTLKNVVKVSVGAYQVLALKKDHTLWSWGFDAVESNDFMNGTYKNVANFTTKPSKLSFNKGKIIDCYADIRWDAFRTNDGSLYLWGKFGGNKMPLTRIDKLSFVNK